MYKKKAISLTSIGLCLLLFLSVLTLPVHAYSYTLETCPHSEGMPTDYLRKKAHEGYIGNNYQTWIDSFGYYYIIHETWDCDLCGYHVNKEQMVTSGILRSPLKDTVDPESASSAE